MHRRKAWSHSTRKLCASALALLVLAAAGCKSPAPTEPAPPPAPASNALPTWRLEPLSWKKLNDMERWLASPSAQDLPGFRTEAALQLNEGRVVFAQRDAENSAVPAEALAVRLDAARSGFQELQKSGALSPGQRTRAEIGLAKVEALTKMPTKPGIVLIERARWGAVPAVAARMTPLRGGWSRITVHHSAETSSDPVRSTLEDSAHTVRLIQKYHMEDPDHKWGDIGYHFLIDSTGRIFQGRELKWQGAHAGGANNNQNIGICMLGDFITVAPTPAAMKSLELLIADLRTQHRIEKNRLYAHQDLVPSTQCPGASLEKWVHSHR